MKVAFFFHLASTAFTTCSGFIGHSFYVLTTSSGPRIGQELESLCPHAGSVISIHQQGARTPRTTLSSAAEARSASAPFGLFLSTVNVAGSVAGNALSSSFLWLET